MRIGYALSDLAHFARMYLRNQRRFKAWSRQYEAAVSEGTFRLSFPAVVQILPTEACNLRCPMCNQWGENGYFLDDVRHPEHMDPGGLTSLLRGLSPDDTFISVHGGEPFVYRHTETLLELLRERQFDVMFSTNGTLLRPYLDSLARLKNLSLLLSIDGDEATHDRIRGRGRYRQAREAIAELFERRRALSMPLPAVIMSAVICEWTTENLEKVYDVADEFGALAINYNFRWFLSEEVGRKYESHLQEEFGLKSSGAWRGWVSPRHDSHDYGAVAASLEKVLRRRKRRLLPPYVFTTPAGLRGKQCESYFTDYLETFGNESCFMPFFWARIHANGDLIYCPGHPDIIAGNVFRGGLMNALNSEQSIRFRKYILNNRLPICNRCCGLYMTRPARAFEQRARRNLGLPSRVVTHWP
jgi:MoaA/NifB/PqqE/SkfB family radical SAM enzyme